MAEPIKMPFGMWTRVGPRNYVLDGVQIPSGRSNSEGGGDVGIFLYATEHHSQWPWCRDFPVCCRPAFQLASHWSSRMRHIKFSLWKHPR